MSAGAAQFDCSGRTFIGYRQRGEVGDRLKLAGAEGTQEADGSSWRGGHGKIVDYLGQPPQSSEGGVKHTITAQSQTR